MPTATATATDTATATATATSTATATATSTATDTATATATATDTATATLTATPTATATPIASMTSLTSSLNPSLYAQSVTFTATVQDLSSNPITCGTVTFNDGATPIASNVPLGSPSSDQAQATTSTLTVGNHNITAVYNPGACLFITSTSPIVVQAVMAPLKITPYQAIFPASIYGGVSGTTVMFNGFVTALNQSAVTVHISTIPAPTTTNNPSGPVSLFPSPNFAVVSDTCSGAALAPNGMPGDSCTFGLTFTATALSATPTTRDFQGTVTVTSDAPGSPQTVTLAGTGIKAVFGQTSAIAFPNTQVGTTSSTTGVETVTNTSSVPVVINSIPAPTGDFGLLASFGSSPCNTSGTTTLAPHLSAGDSCTAGVTFSPTAQGTRTGSLNVTSAYANGSAATTLRGTGTLAALSVTPALQFGIVTHGTTSADKFVTVLNNNPSVVGSNTTVVISGIATSNSTFGIDPAGTTCGTSPTYATSLAPGASCTVAVNFSPPSVGSFSGTLNVSDNAGNGVQKSTLYGTGN